MSAAQVTIADSGASILHRIAAQRRARVARQGHAMGCELPVARAAPVARFGAEPLLVCEVKRRSPSRGDIAPGQDAVAQARRYAEAGVRSISVLTEQDNFGGSLEDLVRIKKAFPGLALLRKDFLLDEEDIEVSWRAGADAVLLIASLLDGRTLAAMHRRARDLGMEALVEAHNEEDVAKCRPFAPPLVGINCRDLATFAVDLLAPVALRPRITWKARLVFESGIRFEEDVLLARSAGFDGVLVGETVMREPSLIPGLASALGRSPGGFWPTLLSLKRAGRPLVKICGITRAVDAEAAAALGADALGFVFAPSKRKARPDLLKELRGLSVLKVAVVAGQAGAGGMPPEVAELLGEGLIDAVQFHGEEQPDECARLAFPYYKAVRVRGIEDVQAMDRYRSPRVLADAYSADAAGGTGRRVPTDLAEEVRRARPLWLAGGIGPDNVGEIVRTLSPELIDASSRLEESSGCKDRAALATYFEEIKRNAAV